MAGAAGYSEIAERVTDKERELIINRAAEVLKAELSKLKNLTQEEQAHLQELLGLKIPPIKDYKVEFYYDRETKRVERKPRKILSVDHYGI